jgi:hypothetical protein
MAAVGRVERHLAELGLELPQQPVPVGNYLPAARVGKLVFTSGQTARINGVRRYVGVVGQEVSEADAYLSARDAMLNCLACVKQAVGSLDRVKGAVKVVWNLLPLGGLLGGVLAAAVDARFAVAVGGPWWPPTRSGCSPRAGSAGSERPTPRRPPDPGTPVLYCRPATKESQSWPTCSRWWQGSGPRRARATRSPRC